MSNIEINKIAFKDFFKCNETFKIFVQSYEYHIVGFGTEKRNGVRIEVWQIKCLSEEKELFTVVKSTINELLKRKILIEINENERIQNNNIN